MPRVIVCDVNETLLDVGALEPHFQLCGSSPLTRGISLAPSVRGAPPPSSRDRARSCIRSARSPTSRDRIFGTSRIRSLRSSPEPPETSTVSEDRGNSSLRPTPLT